MAVIRDTPDDIVVNRASASMIDHAACEVRVRDLAPVIRRAVRLRVRIATDESDDRLGRLADLVGRYCPVDSPITAAVDDYDVSWRRI